jgi:triosephosphate isomerase
MKYFVGNWKANKNCHEVEKWADDFIKLYKPGVDITLGVCPPAPFLSYLQWRLGDLKQVFIGAQTVSSVESGSYTGEVTAKMLDGTVRFVIIGHSERRKHFHEEDSDLATKVVMAKKYNLEPIYCVRDEADVIPTGVKFVAYEPVAAIGTGQNESLDKVLIMKKKMALPQDCVFIYGGSVNEKNVHEYLISDEIDGFLIGKASLDPVQFLAIAGLK